MRTFDAIRMAGALLAPPRCAACADPCRWEDPLCAGCWTRITSAASGRTSLAGLETVRWAAPYEDEARRALTALKFGHRTALAAPLAAAVADVCADLAPGRAVVAVPPARPRLRSRGFDPAALIADNVAVRLRLSLATCLRRTDRRRQVGRRRTDRLASPPAITADGVVPRRVLLVDDVLTTGATLGACARALRAAGCESVAAACFARSV